MVKKDPKKLSMHLNEEAQLHLARLQTNTRASGVADVVRLALLALDEQIEFIRKGGQICFKNGDDYISYNPLMKPIETLELLNKPVSENEKIGK